MSINVIFFFLYNYLLKYVFVSMSKFEGNVIFSHENLWWKYCWWQKSLTFYWQIPYSWSRIRSEKFWNTKWKHQWLWRYSVFRPILSFLCFDILNIPVLIQIWSMEQKLMNEVILQWFKNHWIFRFGEDKNSFQTNIF